MDVLCGCTVAPVVPIVNQVVAVCIAPYQNRTQKICPRPMPPLISLQFFLTIGTVIFGAYLAVRVFGLDVATGPISGSSSSSKAHSKQSACRACTPSRATRLRQTWLCGCWQSPVSTLGLGSLVLLLPPMTLLVCC